MTNRAYPTERSGSDLSGEGSVRPGIVNDRVVRPRGRVHQHLKRSVSLPVPEFTDTAGTLWSEADCYVFGNALRGWVYALLPSVVLCAILIGIIYTLLKR